MCDVLGMRIINDGKSRMRYFWKPCNKCGFSEKNASDYISNEEKHVLKNID